MKTFVIAEAGINHNGNLQMAKDLVYAAKECGCSAVKFQTYDTDRRVSKNSPIYDILKKCELDYNQQKKVKEYADEVGIEFFSTPFDKDAVKFLVEELNVGIVKISSFDITNTKFLSDINEYTFNGASFEIIISTGMANPQEIDTALDCIYDVSKTSILHCVSDYPLHQKDANLSAINTLKLLYPYNTIGYSDHTNDILVPALSVLSGAEIIEKHFTLDLNGSSVDNPVSANPKMMKEMVERIELFEKILGDGLICMNEVEKDAQSFRRKS
jgi:sialic acid synthase SpsE